MYTGTHRRAGPPHAKVLTQPAHPYTKGLLAASPYSEARQAAAYSPAQLPQLTALPPGMHVRSTLAHGAQRECTAQVQVCGSVGFRPMPPDASWSAKWKLGHVDLCRRRPFRAAHVAFGTMQENMTNTNAPLVGPRTCEKKKKKKKKNYHRGKFDPRLGYKSASLSAARRRRHPSKIFPWAKPFAIVGEKRLRQKPRSPECLSASKSSQTAEKSCFAGRDLHRHAGARNCSAERRHLKWSFRIRNGFP